METMSEPQLLKPGENIKIILTLEDINLILKNLYDIIPELITELNGYDDKNYKIIVKCSKTANIKKYVLKFINSLDSKNIPLTEAQSNLMLFLNKNGVTCPKPVKNVRGEYFSIEQFVSGQHCVRLLEYVSGKILQHCNPDASLYYKIGKFTAELDLLLKNFHHPVYDTHKSIWMLDSIPITKQFLFAVNDIAKKEIMSNIFEEFEKRVLNVSKTLEKGIIHGDINEQNIIVEHSEGKWDFKGIIDFGDCQYSCYLFELAIAITYMMIINRDIKVAGYVLAGYNSVRKITDEEYSLLKICVMARLSQSLTMSSYTHLQDPDNCYVLSTSKSGWDVLMQLYHETENDTLDKWALIAKKYTGSSDEANF